MSTFPTARPSYTGFTPGHTLLVDVHASQHNLEQADIGALSDKIGLGASTPTANQVLTGNGVGTSSWSQVNLTTMVSGVLPVANGGTGTTSTTGTGSVVFGTSPTISGANLTNSPTLSTPIIANFTNANHNHQNAAGGGTLSGAAVPALDLSLQTLSNPYKFRVHQVGAQNTGAATPTKVALDTKDYDTSANFDAVTNHRFTATVAGFYSFKGHASATTNPGTFFFVALYKNGSEYKRGTQMNSSNSVDTEVTDDIQLAINDYIELYVFATNNVAMTVNSPEQPVLSGFLISTT